MNKPIPYAVTWAREKHLCDVDYEERCTDECFARVFRMAQWTERGRRLWDAVEAIRKERRNQSWYFSRYDKSALPYQGTIEGAFVIESIRSGPLENESHLVLSSEKDIILFDVKLSSYTSIPIVLRCYNLMYASSHPVSIVYIGENRVISYGEGYGIDIFIRREAYEVESRKT